MRADLIEAVDDAVFGSLADTVTVGGVSAEAIYDPEDDDVPGTELARRSSRVLKLAFRESAGLTLSRGTRVVFRERAYVVDGTPDVSGALIFVSLLPTDDPPLTIDGEFSAEFSRAFDAVVS